MLQEKTNQALLKDHVEKYSELTQSMSKILNSFEQRLGKLEHTILPVYNITKNLQKQQQSKALRGIHFHCVTIC